MPSLPVGARWSCHMYSRLRLYPLELGLKCEHLAYQLRARCQEACVHILEKRMLNSKGRRGLLHLVRCLHGRQFCTMGGAHAAQKRLDGALRSQAMCEAGEPFA